MKIWGMMRPVAAACALAAAAPAAFAQGVGDLLVAPTRLVLDGQRGSELVLNNVGALPATYRVSLELRRMNAEGRLDDVVQPTAAEQAALDMISYAPRRVTLQPNQPQTIRVGVRAPADLPAGEYRAHMLFRAIPEAKPANAAAQNIKIDGVSVALTPIYGISIPVIVRSGTLEGKASISNARLVRDGAAQAMSFDLSRTGNRSLYGEIRVKKQGIADPIVLARGIAIYPEIALRNVTLPLSAQAGAMSGPIRIEYVERAEDGGRVLAEADAVLR